MDLTFFEYPGAARGRVGAGMVHRIVWRVSSEEALGFWQERLSAQGIEPSLTADSLLFSDPEGLAHELLLTSEQQEPLSAEAPDIPSEHALQGFDGVRAYSFDPVRSESLLGETLGFTKDAAGRWEARGDKRSGFYAYDTAVSDVSPVQGAGTVHHVAFASLPEDHAAWRERVEKGHARPTPIIDRFYFRSIYFREPSGVLFEIATIGPGFSVDEDEEHLGERLSLPPRFEPLREQLKDTLTPLPDSRQLHGLPGA
jgi:glyoxalase family protein